MSREARGFVFAKGIAVLVMLLMVGSAVVGTASAKDAKNNVVYPEKKQGRDVILNLVEISAPPFFRLAFTGEGNQLSVGISNDGRSKANVIVDVYHVGPDGETEHFLKTVHFGNIKPSESKTKNVFESGESKWTPTQVGINWIKGEIYAKGKGNERTLVNTFRESFNVVDGSKQVLTFGTLTITIPTIWEDKVVVINGDLHVDAPLTVLNSDVIGDNVFVSSIYTLGTGSTHDMAVPIDGQYKVEVEGSGSLVINGRLWNGASDNGATTHYWFYVNGTLDIDGGIVENMAGDSADLSQPGGIICTSDTVEIKNGAEVKNGQTHGIYLIGSDAKIEGASIHDNGGDGIVVTGGSAPVIVENVISGNGGIGINGLGPRPILPVEQFGKNELFFYQYGDTMGYKLTPAMDPILKAKDQYGNPTTFSYGGSGLVHPDIHFFPDGEGGYKYWLYYTQCPGSDPSSENPCLIRSNDGVTFTDTGVSNPLFDHASIPYSTGGCVADCDVIKVGNKWFMYLECDNTLDASSVSTIVMATSDDGVHWTPYEHNPILSPIPGEIGGYRPALACPTIVYNEETHQFMMWYIAMMTGDKNHLGCEIFLAFSSDGYNWVRCPTNPVVRKHSSGSWDECYMSHMDVNLINGIYKMYYIGATYALGNSAHNNLGIMTSLDGINWLPYQNNPVLNYIPSSSWCAYSIYRSSPVIVDGTLKLYYGGIQSTTNYNIALTSDSPPYVTFPKGVKVLNTEFSIAGDTNPFLTSTEKPKNLKMDIGADGVFEWAHKDILDHSELISDTGDSQPIYTKAIQDYLDKQDVPMGTNIDVPFVFTSDTAGKITLTSNLQIKYQNAIYVQNNIIKNNNGHGITYASTDGIVISKNSIISNSQSGIYLYNCDDCTISENEVSSNGREGIYLSASCRDVITENNIHDAANYGLVFDEGSNYNIITYNELLNNHFGIAFNSCNGCNISDNTVTNTGHEGIEIYRSNNNKITGNHIKNAYIGILNWEATNENLIDNNTVELCWGLGIYIRLSQKTTIKFNTVTTSDIGIYISDFCTENKIYYNNIIGNNIQAFDDSISQWYDAYPNGGNYWSNYIGVDEYYGYNQNIPNCDGYYDTPYTFDYGAEDKYPLVRPTVDGRHSHIPIKIEGNGDFASIASAEHWPGQGTIRDPYVIENYDIDGTDWGYGIYIRDTDVYFNIRNCEIHHVSGQYIRPEQTLSGITLCNVINGVINHNTIHDNKNEFPLPMSPPVMTLGEGVYGIGSSHISVCDNVLYNNNYGVAFDTIYYYSSPPQLNSDWNNVSNNIAYDNRFGIAFNDGDKNMISNNICESNSLEGILLYNSDYNIASNNTISGSYYGLRVRDYSQYNVLAQNYIEGNTRGISLENSEKSFIVHNDLLYNTANAYLEETNENHLYHNNFIGPASNQISIDSYSTINYWYMDYVDYLYNSPYSKRGQYLGGGNHWSDYTGGDNLHGVFPQSATGADGIGDTDYFNNIQDIYPLMQPFAGPPYASNLWVEQSGNDIVLHWQTSSKLDPANWRVYRSNSKSIQSFPSGWTMVEISGSSRSWTHTGANVDGLTWYYIVTGYDGQLIESKKSTMCVKAKLSFVHNAAGANVNWISLPYNTPLQKARDIVIALEGGDGINSASTKVDRIGKWDSKNQCTYTYDYTQGYGWSGNNFDINPGDGFYLNIISISPFNWIITGSDDSKALSFFYDSSNANYQWISLPYTGKTTTALDVVKAIEGGNGVTSPSTKISCVSIWRANTQTTEAYYFDQAFSEWDGSNFIINPGDGIRLDFVSSFTWTPDLATLYVP
ncbi:MAG: right-handed parallel beta-helix repeat-containing protein [Euryarchaeota archaeon]|nr:right-handed parallel beta-helix repeat-containing protein [Euryarchaeota archaeon]